MTGDSNSVLGQERSTQLSVLALDQQIAEHKKADDNRSVLSWAVSQIWRRDEGSLTQLQQLSKEVHEAQDKGDTARVQALRNRIDTAVKSDKDEIGLQSEISHYTGGGLKTAALFFGGSKAGFLSARGGMGLAATVGLYGLDEAKIGDDAASFATNFALGGAKGGLTKGLFHQLGGLPIESPALKGVVLGMGARAIDTGLTGSNYINAEGKFDFTQGLGKLGGQLTDTRAMVIDGLLFSAAHGVTRGANWLTAGAVDARPMYQTVMTSASFGLSGGAYSELDRQVKAGEQIDYGKIFGRALLQGGIDAVAGVPGGLNADANFRTRPIQTLKEDGAAMAERLSSVKTNIAERFGFLKNPLNMESLGFGAGPRPAFAYAMSSMSESPVSDVKVSGRDLSEPPVTVGARPEDRVSRVRERTEPAPMAGEEAKAEAKAEETKAEPKPEETVAPPKEYPPEDVARAEKELDRLTGSLASEAGSARREPTSAEIKDLIDYLKDHPEADQYATKLYVRNFSNPCFRRAIEAFYKPAFAMENELTLAKPDVREAFNKFEAAMRDPANRSILPQVWGERINRLISKSGANGPQLRELFEHYGRTTYDTVLAKAVDAALGTKYAEGLENADPTDVDGIHRQMPLTQADIEYVRATAQGKQLPYPRLANLTVDSLLDSSDSALAALRPERVGAVDTDLDTAGTGTERTERPRPEGIVPDYIREAQAGIRDNIMKQVELMRTGTPEQQAQAAEVLADQLRHESSTEWFKDWMQQVGKTHLTGAGELATPAVQAVVERAPDAVRTFLNAEGTLQQSIRYRTLSEIASAFEGKPEVTEAILRSAGNDVNAMRNIGYELTRGFARGAYAKWLEKQFTPAEADGATPQLAVEQINGPNAMQAARIYGAFGEGPVAQHLSEYAAANPELAAELMKKVPDAGAVGRDGKPARGADVKQLLEEVVQRRIAEGVGPTERVEQFNPDLLGMELRLKNAFRFNPTALDSLLTFARSNLDVVASVIRMPGEQPQQQGARRTGPPDRNDPAVKLSRAYTDFIGIIAPEAAKLGPEQGLARLQEIQRLFADSISKNKRFRQSPDDTTLAREAELAERELNKATNDLLPQDAEQLLDAQRRREAVAKQDADLLPNRQPPRPGGDRRPPREPRDGGRGPQQQQRVADPPADPPVVPPTEPPVDPKVDPKVDPQSRVETPPERVEETPPERVDDQLQPPPLDLGAGPESTINQIDQIARRNAGARPDTRGQQRTNPPPRVDQSQLDLIAAEEQARQEEWRSRKGRNDEYDEAEDYGGSGRKPKRQGRPKDHRRPRDDDWRNWEDE